jgi:hypothetical protein
MITNAVLALLKKTWCLPIRWLPVLFQVKPQFSDPSNLIKIVGYIYSIIFPSYAHHLFVGSFPVFPQSYHRRIYIYINISIYIYIYTHNCWWYILLYHVIPNAGDIWCYIPMNYPFMVGKLPVLSTHWVVGSLSGRFTKPLLVSCRSLRV